jgi:hypothetical protein
VKSRENHGPNLDPSSFNLDLFFVCTYKYIHTYCTSLRYYITPKNPFCVVWLPRTIFEMAWTITPTSLLGLTFVIANKDNTKDNRAKQEREQVGDLMEIKHNT